jgi:hypothetical protein
MSVFQFNTGIDTTLTIITQNGPLSISIQTSFDCKQMVTSLRSKGLNGNNYFAEIPMGWEANFKLDKASDSVDAFFAAIESDYYNGGNITGATVSQLTNNPDGSVSEYTLIDGAFKFDNAGEWAGDKKVEQTFSLKANKRLKVQ